ncbi:hypothetical protein A1OO_17720 [Enterovibrio norvegicus FF-33]|uniref:hypothetical protein n=1 Tax=Enterovibrio norvegicus TaxID=188144 RepID=UPI0002E8E13F|nr:hypothetical protein [Enterovibrio norvegicus]OEE67582.1 hypothetical protein A1OO_17720 [Enterovibrio norvegicus FF-33]
MYPHNYLKLLLLPIIFTLTACGESVTFSPEIGDEKRYWAYAHTTRDVATNPETVMLSESLLHYKVEQTGDALSLHITPEHLQFSTGHSGFSSVDSSKRNPQIQKIFSAGFDVSLNSESGELTDFTARNKDQWESFVKRGGQILMNSLQSTINAPGFIQSIPVKAGSEVQLTDFKGVPVTLTVQSVSEKTVFATMSSKGTEASSVEQNVLGKQLFGQIEINRSTGWLEKMLLVMNIPVEVYGKTKMTQFAFAMHPEDESVGTFAEIFYNTYYDEEQHWFDIVPLSKGQPTNEMLTAEDVLPYPRGMLLEEEAGFRLAYPTDVAKQQQIGRIAFRDVRGYIDGQPTDVKFAAPLDQQFIDEGMNVSAHIQPLGWQIERELNDLETVAAFVDYYNVSETRYNVPWTGGKTQTFQLGEITLTATLVAGTQNEYRLEYTNTVNSRLALTVGGLQGQISFPSDPNLPSWLAPSSKQMLSFLGNSVLQQNVIAVKLFSAPTEVTFIVHSQSDVPSFTREVVFWDQAWFLSSAEMPPMGIVPSDNYLFDVKDLATSSEQESTFDFNNDLHIDTESPHNAVVALPYVWENVCQFSIDNTPHVSGHPLVWKPQPKTSNDVAGGPTKIEDNTTAYQFTTPDGIRRYFYDMEITTRLSCEGTPSWEEMALAPSPFPWLIDVSKVAGFDPQQSVKQFISGYRIYNKHGEPLSPIDRYGKALTAGDSPLSEALFDGTYIKMSGKISRIEHFSVEGEPLERVFVTMFPPLAKG